MDQNVVSYSDCAEGLTEILELLLLVLETTEDFLIDVQIRSLTDHIGGDMIFLIKIISSRHFCIETLFKSYRKYLQKFSNLIMKMQMKENESHISISFCENGEMIRKSYILETEIDGSYKLKCTKHKTKPAPNSTNTVLHLRMFQSKHRMMLLGKTLYRYLKQISLCSKVSLGLSLTIQENVCHFDLRTGETDDIDSVGHHVSTNTEYLLSETEFHPSSISTKVAVRDIQKLPTITDLSNLDFQLVTSGLKTNFHFNICTPSLVMLSWYGPGNVPLLEIGDAKSEIHILKSLDWSQYGIILPMENSLLWEVLYISIDVIPNEDPEKKLEALSWLRKHKSKWMENFQEKIESSLDSVIGQVVKSKRPAEEDRIASQYSSAITSISTSISSVILRSSCEHFRGKCYQLLETEEKGSIQKAVIKKLWYITENMGIFQPVHGLKSEEFTLEENRSFECASQLELQKGENENAVGNEICIHKDDLKGLNWISEENEASSVEPFQEIHIPKFRNSDLEGEKTGVSQESKATTVDSPCSKEKWGCEGTNSDHEDSNENTYHVTEESYVAIDYHKSSISQNSGYSKCSCEDNENNFPIEMEAEDNLSFEGIANDIKMGPIYQDKLDKGMGSPNQCVKIQVEKLEELESLKTIQQELPLQKRIIPPVNTESIDKSNTVKISDNWLDDALMEMRDWFDDE